MNLLLSLVLSLASWSISTPAHADSVRVSDADATLLFRYVGGAFESLPDDGQRQILHSELMMCSILFKGGVGPTVARCRLPFEQISFDKDNAVDVTNILKKYNMPNHFKFGYETIEAGLDCTNHLSFNEYPICYLTPKSSVN